MTVYLSPGLRDRLDQHMDRTGLKTSSYVQRIINRDLLKEEIKAGFRKK